MKRKLYLTHASLISIEVVLFLYIYIKKDKS